MSLLHKKKPVTKRPASKAPAAKVAPVPAGPATVTATLSDDSFYGELLGLLADDPTGLGHAASGKIASAVTALREAATCAAEARGTARPTGYVVSITADGDTFDVAFKVA